MTINYALGGIPMKAVMAYCKALSLHLLQRNKKNYTTFSYSKRRGVKQVHTKYEYKYQLVHYNAVLSHHVPYNTATGTMYPFLFNPIMPELNPSKQCCLLGFFTGDFKFCYS
jgi:hypothetical protein